MAPDEAAGTGRAPVRGAIVVGWAFVVAYVAATQPRPLLGFAVGLLVVAVLTMPRSRAAAPGWLGRCLAGGALVIFALLLKDLLPSSPLSGAAERLQALGGAELAWPATARNPALGAAAAQLAGLLLAGVLVAALADRIHTRDGSRVQAGVEAVAWALAAFGAAVWLLTKPGLVYGPGNAVGLVANKNGAGALLGLAVVLHVGLGVAAARSGRRLAAGLHSLAAAGLGLPLLRTGSWTALLALGAGLTVLLARRNWGATARASGLAAFVVVMLAAFDPRLAARLGSLAADYRWEIWRDAFPLWVNWPGLGVGLGAFEPVYPLFGALELPYDARLFHPDSSLVKLILEWGLVPVALGAALLLRAALRAGPAGPAGRIAGAGLAAGLASGLTDVTWHRPESLLILAVLAGLRLAARPPEPPAGNPRGMGWREAGAGLALATVIGAWAAGPGARELRWGLLDPARLWIAAGGGDGAAATPELRREQLRAAVRLEHRSVAFPWEAARGWHASDPQGAREFWILAVRRAGGNGEDYFARAMAAFPATPPAYWCEVAAASDPNLLLLVEETDGSALRAWRAVAPTPITPAIARALLERLERGRPAPLEAALPGLGEAEPRYWERAARGFLAAGRPVPAWAAARHLLPPADDSVQAVASVPTVGAGALLAVKDYPGLQSWSRSLPAGERRRGLELICAAPDAPPWFHFELARLLAADGEVAAAVNRVLAARAYRADR